MTSISSSLGGRTLTSPDFQEETRSFLQQRLRLLTGTLTTLLLVLSTAFVLSMAAGPRTLLESLGEFARFPNLILLILLVSNGALYGVLRSRALPSATLGWVDVVFLQVLIAPCILLYFLAHNFAFSGFAFVVPFLMLFILARAVLIPSEALRTVFLSISAPIGVLLVQIYHGDSLAAPGRSYGPNHFMDMLIQNQVCLVGAIAVAAVASRVNLGLRRRTFDARKIGKYKIDRPLGVGAMGEVYLGTHALLKRPTAIKFLRPDITGEKNLMRFEREVRQTSRLTHPNAVSIFDYGHTADGLFYYAMEYLEGADLKQIVAAAGALQPGRVIYLLSQACGALHEAHSKGMVHRDIKPANIMLCQQGGEYDFVKILDFGLVRDLKEEDTDEGSIVGTPETMAPETIRRQPPSPAADLYSLSAVGYFLLTGRPVFPAANLHEMLEKHLSAAPPRPSLWNSVVAEDLEAVILRGLAKDPAARPESAAVLRAQLHNCQQAGEWDSLKAEAWWQSFDAEQSVHPTADAETAVLSDSTVKTMEFLPDFRERPDT